MLNKLLKYEFKATGRMFLPLYGALIIFALLNKIFISINAYKFAYGLPAGIAMTVYVFIIIAICVVTFLVMIQRFYKNLLGDEGYLMFTLPVRPWQHIITKMIVSTAWTFISGAATLFSIFLIAVNKEMMAQLPSFLSEVISQINGEFGIHGYLWGLELLLGAILCTAAGALIIYLCIAVGHIAKRHKILTSFGCYLAITAILQVVMTIFIAIMDNTPFYTWVASLPDIAIGHLVLWAVILFNVALGAASFFLTNFILTRKLNLE